MPFIEESLEKFQFELPEEIQLTCDTREVVVAIKNIQDEFGFDLSDVVIFFVVGDMTLEEIPLYLENEYEIDKILAKKITDRLEEKILRPLTERVNFLNQHPEKDMTIDQEKIYAENIFKKNLLPELEYDPIIKAGVNERLFFILANDINFKKKLEQGMYENNELLTKNSIIIDGKEQRPTIGNWIKDFIAHYGSQAYNSVNVSAFVINSENGKKLTDEERRKLLDIIKIYTSIRFFPDSMPDSDDDDWQIIPYEIEKPVAIEKPSTSNRSLSIEDKVIPNSSLELKASTPVSPISKNQVESVAAAQPEISSLVQPESSAVVMDQIIKTAPTLSEIGDDADLAELKNMLLQYPAGSLERAAIEEEIKTLQKK